MKKYISTCLNEDEPLTKTDIVIFKQYDYESRRFYLGEAPASIFDLDRIKCIGDFLGWTNNPLRPSHWLEVVAVVRVYQF